MNTRELAHKLIDLIAEDEQIGDMPVVVESSGIPDVREVTSASVLQEVALDKFPKPPRNYPRCVFIE